MSSLAAVYGPVLLASAMRCQKPIERWPVLSWSGDQSIGIEKQCALAKEDSISVAVLVTAVAIAERSCGVATVVAVVHCFLKEAVVWSWWC